MRAVFIGVAAVLLAAGTAVAEDAASPAFCASCHGTAGAPHDTTIPVIWGQQASYLEKQLRDYRAGDRESQIMSSVAEGLSDAQIAALATTFSQAAWPAIAAPAAALPPLASACVGCHQASFMGAEVANVGSVPRLAGQQAAYLRMSMQAYANGQRTNSSVMPALMKALKPDDRAAIAAALAALPGH
jgi:cytochrome c553